MAGLSDEARAGLVSLMQEKLKRMEGLSSGYIESLPKKVRDRLSALQELQSEHDKLEEAFLKERAEIEAKYQKLYDPLYVKRAEIVNGVVEPPVKEPAADESAPAGDEKKEAADEDVTGVPEFWLTALKNNDVLQEQIMERDEGALQSLKDIQWTPLEEGKGFKLSFFFGPNAYFKNEVLSKTYHMVDDEEPILERAIGTTIEWLPGKNVTQKVLKKKPKKGAKNTKPVTKVEACDSFFNFFSPPQVPEDGEEIDEEEAEQLQDAMEQDYEIGSTLKEKIIPHAVSWFTGEAVDIDDFLEEGDDDEDDDEDEDGDDEDDEDEDDEDEDEDEDEEHSKKKPLVKKQGQRGGQAAKAATGGKAAEQPPECKQQ